MSTVGIIGLGRFGKILVNILQKGFNIIGFDKKKIESMPGVNLTSLSEVAQQKVIFIAVPIRFFEDTIIELAKYIKDGTTIVDVCSVKIYPSEIMKEHLSSKIGKIATHPMFGPDSFMTNKKLKMMMHSIHDINGEFKFWVEYFSDQNINIMEMTPNEHDELAAKTQGVTHFLGRMLTDFSIKKTSIDTQGFTDLLDLVDQTCNDTWELYTDLQLYNPYTLNVIDRLNQSTNLLNKQLKELKDVGKR